MKRLHQIATIRRLVALTVLSAMLFSSTAVYADTAVDGTNPSGDKVVIEETGYTSNTSYDINSSNNLDTVSGTDTIDDSSNTTIENDTADTQKAAAVQNNLGDYIFGSDDPCDHDETVISYEKLPDNQHKVITRCADCGETLNEETVSCSLNVCGYQQSAEGKHIEILKCECGNESQGEEIECDFKPTGKYEKVGEDSHREKLRCDKCGQISYSEPVECEMVHDSYIGSLTKDTHQEKTVCKFCHREKLGDEEPCTLKYAFEGECKGEEADHYVYKHIGLGTCETCGYALLPREEECHADAEYVYNAKKTMLSTTVVDGNVVPCHTKISHCATCGVEMHQKVACEFDEYVFDETTRGENTTSKHQMIHHCTECGQAQTEIVDCEFNDWHYFKRGDDGFFSDWHYESRECQVCGYQETRKVSCNWSKKYKFADLEFCEDCFNIHDSRKQSEKLISKVELLTADGDALERTESIKDEAGHTHNVYDEDVKVVVTIDSSNFNNEKTEDDWIKNMEVELCLNTPEKDVHKMSYVKNSMTSDGTAKFEYTVKVPVDKSLSIAGVKAKYTFDEDYKKNLGKLKSLGNEDEYHLFDEYIAGDHVSNKNASGSEEIAAIVRNQSPSMYITNSKIAIANEDNSWRPGKTEDDSWYSKSVNGGKDIIVTVSGTTGKPLTSKAVSLFEQQAKKGIEAEPKVTKIEKSLPWDDFKTNVYVLYSNEYKFVVAAGAEDIKDGKHTYNISNSNIKDDIDLYIDNTKPKYNKVTYTSSADRKNGKYYAADVKVTVVAVDEHINYDKSKSFIYFTSDEATKIPFDSSNATAEVTASKDGQYTIAGIIYDKAGNFVSIDKEAEFVVDKTAPTIQVNFDNNEYKHEKYYKEDRTATFILEDVNIDNNEADIAKVIYTAKEGKATANAMQGSDGKYTGTIQFNEDGIYKIDELKFEDKAGNLCKLVDKSDKNYNAEFVIDKTVPVIKVDFDNKNAANQIYYKAKRTAEITFKEHNFNKDQVFIKKSGSDQDPVPGFTAYSNSGDNNITKINYEKDGRYGFELYTEDMAGNISETVVVDTFVIDMTAPELEITGVENMSANNGSVVPFIKSRDVNINDASTEITLTGSNNGAIKPNITKTTSTEIFTYTIADLPREKKNDDLYTLAVKLTDHAGNEVEKKIQYSVNRFGSVFALSDATKAMVDGYYVTKPQDVVITEINVDALSKKEVSVAFDGSVKELHEGSSYTTSDTTNSKGWHSISYTIGKSNFNKDGIYSVTIYSEDKASNRQSNQSKETEIEFLLDKTAPSVIVSGIEDGGVYEEETHDFSINAADTIGVKDMTVYLNNEKLGSYTASELSANGGTVVLSVPTKDDYQKVSIVCSDVAGNTTNLAYNNLLVSVKAIELLEEDNLTPTSKLADTEESIVDTVSNSSKVLIVVIIGFAAIICGGAGAYAYRKKKN